jgi:transcriptional regulator with XRE-family HTH domain
MADPRLCPACGTRLSRYNTDPLCSACMSASHNRSVAVPQWLWDSAPLRHALADLNLGAVLAIVRASAGLSQLELGTLLGWDQSKVQRAEKGTRDSLYDIRTLLEVVDALDMPRTALAPLVLGAPDAIIEEKDMDLTRRQFGGVMGGATLAAMAGVGAELGTVQIPAKVDKAHIRYLRATVDQLYERDQMMGGAALARGALRQFYRAQRMLGESDYGERTGQQLMTAAGELAVCVGWLAYDAGDQDLARRLYTEAMTLADEADDSTLAIQVREKMALQAVQLARNGTPAIARQALRLTGRAAEAARRDPEPRVHALLAAREAIACAVLGDDRGYRQAITRAWREADRGPGPGDPVWLRFVTGSEISVAEAKGHMYLGAPHTAVQLYEQSLTGDGLSPRNRVNYRAQLAAALAATGDNRAAISEGLAVLPALETDVASPRTLRELAPVREAAEKAGDEEFCAQYDHATQGAAT